MKQLFSFLFLLSITLYSSAQTKIIAHKSHSGNMQHLSIKGAGNFGLDERMFIIDSIIRISETHLVQINRIGQRDTLEIEKYPAFSDPYSSLEDVFATHEDVTFIGFDDYKMPVEKEKETEEEQTSRPLALLLLVETVRA